MRFKIALAALMAVGVVFFASALWSPAGAMGPVGPSAANKAENTLVEKVHRRWRRGGYYAYYPRHRYRPYYYQPYYYSYARPYRYYDDPYYGAYYGPRYYGYGFGRPRFGFSIGF